MKLANDAFYVLCVSGEGKPQRGRRKLFHIGRGGGGGGRGGGGSMFFGLFLFFIYEGNVD